MPVMSIYKNHVVTVTAHTKTNIFNYLAQAFIVAVTGQLKLSVQVQLHRIEHSF